MCLKQPGGPLSPAFHRPRSSCPSFSTRGSSRSTRLRGALPRSSMRLPARCATVTSRSWCWTRPASGQWASARRSAPQGAHQVPRPRPEAVPRKQQMPPQRASAARPACDSRRPLPPQSSHAESAPGGRVVSGRSSLVPLEVIKAKAALHVSDWDLDEVLCVCDSCAPSCARAASRVACHRTRGRQT